MHPTQKFEDRFRALQFLTDALSLQLAQSGTPTFASLSSHSTAVPSSESPAAPQVSKSDMRKFVDDQLLKFAKGPMVEALTQTATTIAPSILAAIPPIVTNLIQAHSLTAAPAVPPASQGTQFPLYDELLEEICSLHDRFEDLDLSPLDRSDALHLQLTEEDQIAERRNRGLYRGLFKAGITVAPSPAALNTRLMTLCLQVVSLSLPLISDTGKDSTMR